MRKREIEVCRHAFNLRGYPERVRVAAAAITLTEMYFRPNIIRLAEHMVALVRRALGMSIGHLTLGISQVSIRHVEQSHRHADKSALDQLMQPAFGLRECCRFIASHRWETQDDLLHVYNGVSSKFYARLLAKNHVVVKAAFHQLSSTHPSSTPR